MTRGWKWMVLALASTALALAQHGNGRGPAGGHGAPPVFAPPGGGAAQGASAAGAAQGAGVSTPKGMKTGQQPAGAAATIPNMTVADRVANNQALSTRLQPLLPTGATIQSAATGFKNTGQFVAALHVSRNLNIPFSQLKAQMTGANRVSLGQAIHNLRPSLNKDSVKSDVKTAEREAHADLRTSRVRMDAAAISTQIAQNPVLARRVRNLLPSGMTVQTAAAGFRNEGQFLAALHVARNLNIPFTQLQSKVSGGESLGNAIRDLRPDLSKGDARDDVRLAELQARRDMRNAAERAELAERR